RELDWQQVPPQATCDGLLGTHLPLQRISPSQHLEVDAAAPVTLLRLNMPPKAAARVALTAALRDIGCANLLVRSSKCSASTCISPASEGLHLRTPIFAVTSFVRINTTRLAALCAGFSPQNRIVD